MPREAEFKGTPFQEAIDFFQSKVRVPTRAYTDLMNRAHSKAFMVAGAMRDDLLCDLQEAIGRAFTAGDTLEEYFEWMGDKIGHIHLNDGRPTGHMKWGDGIQDLDAHLNAMRKHNYTHTITMEMANGAYMLDPEPHYRANIETLRAHFDGGELV